MTVHNAGESRIGYSLDGMPFSFILVFVHADFEAVVNSVESHFTPQGDKPPVGIESVFFQFDDAKWTGFLYDHRCIASVSDLSSRLRADCVVLQHDACSSWTLYQVISCGRIVEEYEFGFVDEEYRNTPVPGWHVVTCDENGYEFRFRSSLRTLEENDLKPQEKFLDRAFRSREIWCPDWTTISKLPNALAVRSETRTIYW